jgi:hypothetical protein
MSRRSQPCCRGGSAWVSAPDPGPAPFPAFSFPAFSFPAFSFPVFPFPAFPVPTVVSVRVFVVRPSRPRFVPGLVLRRRRGVEQVQRPQYGGWLPGLL